MQKKIQNADHDDFYYLLLTRGYPPKVILLQPGNYLQKVLQKFYNSRKMK